MLKEKEINGRKYHLVARSWSTSRAWGHDAELYVDGDVVHTSRARYYNRTWECYQYQTVMINCLYEYREELLNRYEYIFRDKFNVKRMTKHLRETFEAWLKEHPIWETIKGLESWEDEL